LKNRYSYDVITWPTVVRLDQFWQADDKLYKNSKYYCEKLIVYIAFQGWHSPTRRSKTQYQKRWYYFATQWHIGDV